MASKLTFKGQLAQELVEKFPETAKKNKSSLARILYRENIEVYKDFEEARIFIRRICGSAGDKERGARGRATGQVLEKPVVDYNPYRLPVSHAEDWPAYVIPTNINNVLNLSDIHAPYHDVRAITAAIQYGKEREVNGIILNGDFMDHHTLSKYQTNPKKKKFHEELEIGKELLEKIKNVLPNAMLYFKLGNHDVRYDNYMIVKAPELLGVKQFEYFAMLGLDELRAEGITDKRMIQLGDLNILHGHEFQGAVGQQISPAKGVFDRATEDVIIGHVHKTSVFKKRTLTGKTITCRSTGCLSELHPDFAVINQWNLGFAHHTISGGITTTLNYEIDRHTYKLSL